MGLLARLHGVEGDDGSEADRAPRLSVLVGVIASGIVVAHLAALGLGGAVLFLRSGTGYSGRETFALALMSVVGVLAFARVGAHVARRWRLGHEGRR